MNHLIPSTYWTMLAVSLVIIIVAWIAQDFTVSTSVELPRL